MPVVTEGCRVVPRAATDVEEPGAGSRGECGGERGEDRGARAARVVVDCRLASVVVAAGHGSSRVAVSAHTTPPRAACPGTAPPTTLREPRRRTEPRRTVPDRSRSCVVAHSTATARRRSGTLVLSVIQNPLAGRHRSGPVDRALLDQTDRPPARARSTRFGVRLRQLRPATGCD